MRVVVLAFFLTIYGCSNTEFSGTSPTEKQNKNSAKAGGENLFPEGNGPNGDAESGQGGKFGTPQGGNGGANQKGEIVENSDGTVSENFFGLTTIKSTVKVDVIIAMDTSGSMIDEKNKLEDNMEKFLKEFNDTPGVDHQVFMIGGGLRVGNVVLGYDFDFPDLDKNRFDHIDQHVSSTDALFKLKDFIDGDYDSDLELRKDTVKELLVVTDDNSENFSASDFKDYLKSKEDKYGKFRFNGFVWRSGKGNNGQSWCTKAREGTVYEKLAGDDKFGGMIQHLCNKDWGDMIKQFAERIIELNAEVEFPLGRKVDPNAPIRVLINNQDISTNYWQFDTENNSLIFIDGLSPQAGDLLVVHYSPL